MLQALELDLARRVVFQIRRRRAGARAEDETEAVVESDIIDQLHQGDEIGIGFTGKADDEVRRYGDVRPHLAQPANDRLVFQRRVTAFHCRQNTVGAVLRRQIQLVDQYRYIGIDIDQALRELFRMAGHEADALDAVDLGDVYDQQRVIGDL